MLMWPAEPEDLVRHITRGEIRPIMQWLDKGPRPVNHARPRANSPPRSPPGAPSAGARKPGAAKMKRPARPPSAPALSSLPAKPPRPQSAATGLLRPQSAATGLLRPQSAATGFQHTPSAALLGQATAQPKPRPKKTLPASATHSELTRPLKRTTSGNTLPPRRGQAVDDGMDGPVVLGGPGGPAAMSHAAGRRAQMRHAASMQALQSPYNQSIQSAGPKRGGGGGGGGQGFRSDALQLEVKLAEGLQALQNAEARSNEQGENPRRRAQQRLQLFRSLWEKVIERDASFGVLLRRIKAEYESALTLQGGGLGPEEGDAAALRRENLELKQMLQQASRRERELNEQLEAYETKLYEQQRQLQQQGAALAQQRMYDQEAYEDEEAMAAEVAAQLAEEMPASARPGSITPSLGSGRLATIQPPPAKPACIPSLDMNIVAAAREAEARAEAEAAAEEAAAAEAEAAAAGGGAHGGACGHAGDDYGSDEEGEALSDEVRPPARPGIVPSLGAGLAAMGNLPRADYHEEFMALEAQAAGPKYDGGEVDSIVQQVDDRMYAQDPSRGRPDCEPRVLSEGAVEG